jgi:hypothetical protein
MKKTHKKIVGNQILGSLDLFSVPIKLNLNGQQQYQTVFSGCINIILMVMCLLLTISMIYPNGIQLNSTITKTTIAVDYGDNGQTIFDHSSQPISFRMFYQPGDNVTEVSIKGIATLYAYQMHSDGTTH